MELFAQARYDGDLSKGHWTAECRQQLGLWYLTNDEVVMPMRVPPDTAGSMLFFIPAEAGQVTNEPLNLGEITILPLHNSAVRR